MGSRRKRSSREDIEFRRLIFKAVGLLCLGVFCFMLYKYDPNDWGFLSCPSMYMGHLKCPFCGNLIAFHHLFNGDISEALAKNAVGMLVTILIVVMIFMPNLGRNLYLRVFVVLAIITWTLARAFAKYEFFSDLLGMFGL